MTLSVEVVPGRVPSVVLSGGVPGFPVVGKTVESGREWVVSEGPLGFRAVDPLAPLGETFHYVNGSHTSEPLFLESQARDVLMSPPGDLVVECFRTNQRDLELDRGVTTIWPKNSKRPWIMYPKEARGFLGPLDVAVDALNSDLLVKLLEVSTPVVVKHNQERCTVKRCRVERVQVLTVESATDRYLGQDHEGEVSEWSLSVTPDELAGVVAARSWWHTLNEYDSWFGVDLIGEAFK